MKCHNNAMSHSLHHAVVIRGLRDPEAIKDQRFYEIFLKFLGKEGSIEPTLIRVDVTPISFTNRRCHGDNSGVFLFVDDKQQ
jgi:hypothetical protein